MLCYFCFRLNIILFKDLNYLGTFRCYPKMVVDWNCEIGTGEVFSAVRVSLLLVALYLLNISML